MPEPLFALGQLVSTPGALAALTRNRTTPLPFIQRHVTGDWGDLPESDKQENDVSIDEHLRILSAYTLADQTKIWIITEANRSSTCILLPEEY